MISFFLNKKLNFLYIILPTYGILITTILSELHLTAYLREWTLLFNPGLALVLVFGVFGEKHNMGSEFNIILVTIGYLVYWIPATFVTIKIIEWFREILNSRKLKSDVP